MTRAFIYLLVALVVASSCFVEYGAVRLFSSVSLYKQNRIGIVFLALCSMSLVVFPGSIVATNCFVLAVALVAGALLGRQVGSVGALSTMLIVAAIVDLISVHAGPSRWLVDQAQNAHGVRLLQFLAISIHLKGRLVPVIGVGDLMFFTAVVSVVRRLGWSETAALVVPLAGILAALGVGIATGFTAALPFLAGAVFLYAYRAKSLGHEPCRG